MVQLRPWKPATCDRQCCLADFAPKTLPSECGHGCQIVPGAAPDIEDSAPAERRKCSCFQSEQQTIGQKTQCFYGFKKAFSFSPNCMRMVGAGIYVGEQAPRWLWRQKDQVAGDTPKKIKSLTTSWSPTL